MSGKCLQSAEGQPAVSSPPSVASIKTPTAFSSAGPIDPMWRPRRHRTNESYFGILFVILCRSSALTRYQCASLAAKATVGNIAALL